MYTSIISIITKISLPAHTRSDIIFSSKLIVLKGHVYLVFIDIPRHKFSGDLNNVTINFRLCSLKDV